MTLYEMTADMLRLLEVAEEEDMDEQVLADTMEAMEGEFEYKADGYAKVIRQLEADAEGLKKEIDRLSKRKKALENSKETIKKRLEGAMLAVDKRKFKTEFFSFGIQKNPASVRFVDGFDSSTAPAEYLVFRDPEVDKKKIKEDLKNGKELEFAYLEQTEGLRIR